MLNVRKRKSAAYGIDLPKEYDISDGHDSHIEKLLLRVLCCTLSTIFVINK